MIGWREDLGWRNSCRDNLPPPNNVIIMATKKTAPFTLTERLTLATGASPTVSGTIDLGSYVDVGDRQGIMIHSVDYIFQGATAGDDVISSMPAASSVLVQTLDLNRGGLVFANDRALISSSALTQGTANDLDRSSDLFPDNFGKGAMDGRTVVNDQLYLEAKCTGTTTAQLNVTVRVTASIVKLSQVDFMAIAIQSTAADN